MNRKQFAILLVLLIVLGGFGWYVQQGRNRAASSGEQGAGQKLLGDAFPVNDVTRISIKEGANEVNLVKLDDLWRVRERGNYPANFPTISETLLQLQDLKVVQTEQVGASQLPRLQLAPPGQGTNSGVLVDLRGKDDKSIQTLTLGKKHMHKAPPGQPSPFGGEGMPDGRYVLLAGNSQSALLVADPLSSLESKPEEWLDKDFFKVERPKAIAVTFPATTNSWKIQRDAETGDWKLAGAKADEKLDDARVSGVSSPFSSPSFNDVLSTNTKPSEVGLDKPTVVTVETFDDLTYTVKIGAKSGDNYPLTLTVTANFPKERVPAKDEKLEDKAIADKAWTDRRKQLEETFKRAKQFEGWVYLVPTWTVDPILKDRKDLIAEKKEEPKTAGKSSDKATPDSAKSPSIFDDKSAPTGK